MFNADLALSVTMTAISTLLSTIFLPVNLLIYARYSYEADVIMALDWTSLFVALSIVIGAIGLGLFCSAKIHSHKFNLMANHVRNTHVQCIVGQSFSHNSTISSLEIGQALPSSFSRQQWRIRVAKIRKFGNEIGNFMSEPLYHVYLDSL